MFELPIQRLEFAGKQPLEDRISRIISKHHGTRGSLIATLEQIQDEYGYLSEEALRWVSIKTGKSTVDVYGVATFYNLFNLKPRGQHLISVCLGTACHVRSSQAIVDEFKKQLGIEVGATTSDRLFTLKTVNCLGACALGPVAVIDGRYFSKLRPSSVKSLIEATAKSRAAAAAGDNGPVFPVDVNCPSCQGSLMDDRFLIQERPSVKVDISFDSHLSSIRISSFYGRYEAFSESEIPVDTIVKFFCPHCRAELVCSWNCSRCDAPMAEMAVRGGGKVRVCSRRGCTGSKSHMLDLG
jgi:NADH:ubiquinone oxidoreductase subunit E